MKKVFKVILIILGAFIFALMLVKCAGETTLKAISEPHMTPLVKVPNQAVYRSEIKQLFPKTDSSHLVIDSDYITSNFTDGEYYTFATFDSGEQIQGKRNDDTDTFTIYLLSPSYADNNITERFTLAIYSTADRELEYNESNLQYNVINYVDGNNITYSTLFELTYLDFLDTYSDNILNLPVVNYSISYLDNYNQGYSDGYGAGVYQGVRDVQSNPSQYGYYTSSQYDDLRQAYDELYAQADSDFTQSAFKNLLNQVIGTPYNAFKGMFNFEFFGVNLFNLFSFLFTCAIVGYLIKKII